jgi:hypothetical protein
MRRNLFFILLLAVTFHASAQVNSVSISNTFSNFANSAGKGSMVQLQINEETEGSPFLVKGWASGKVFLKNGSVLNEPAAVLNFNKMDEDIIVKQGPGSIMTVNMGEIVSFSLSDSGKEYHFVRLPEYKNKFYNELYSDSAYSIYSKVQTTFYKADYVNKGLTESGHKYDRYEDKTYYLLKVNKQNQYIDLNELAKKDLRKLEELNPALKDFIKKEYSSDKKEEVLIGAVKLLPKKS